MKNINLNDPTIRKALLEKLAGLPTPPRRILEELTVHEGKAIADVVAVHQTPHCYEIKGEKDSISRVIIQGKYYDAAFQKITLVTTERHLDTALRIAPPHWGIILARLKRDSIIFRYIRKAKKSPGFQSQTALLTLWRSELIELAQFYRLNKPEKLNRQELSENIAHKLSKDSTDIEIAKKLTARIYKTTKSRSM